MSLQAPRTLRIAIWHNLPSGGGKRALFNHVKGLVERGHHVESWCPDTASQQYLALGNLISEHVVPLGVDSSAFEAPVRKVSVVRRLVRAMESHAQLCAAEMSPGDFDVVLANTCQYLRTSPIAKFVQCPSVLYLQEPYRTFYEALPALAWLAPPQSKPSWLYEIARRAYGRPTSDGVQLQANMEVAYARAFRRILVNSSYSRESVLRAYNVESQVCYLGVDTNHFHPSTAEKLPFVVGLGTIQHAKGIDRAIRAIATIDHAVRPTLVWIANAVSHADHREYTLLASSLDVAFEARIGITDDELIATVSRASAMVYTSRLEPFGFAPLEANACGTAVVAIAEGGVKETMRDGVTGFVVQDDDPIALGRHIRALTTDLTLAKTLGLSARDHVVRHWDLSAGTDAIERALLAMV